MKAPVRGQTKIEYLSLQKHNPARGWIVSQAKRQKSKERMINDEWNIYYWMNYPSIYAGGYDVKEIGF